MANGITQSSLKYYKLFKLFHDKPLVGIAAFTGASYNSLLFSAVFIAEASGNPALVVPGLIGSSVAYLIGAGVSNSPSQKYERLDVISIPVEAEGGNNDRQP